MYEEAEKLIEVGLYKPHFNFGDSNRYKARIAEVRESQKHMVLRKDAVFCTQTWTVNGSAREGKMLFG